MSLKKGGFSTLNRWLGIKNKDKVTPNGKLSKSSTNLSVSTTDMSEPSQLEYNRITPVPAATSNAPFEQTFRITVLLPKDQLYVARLGARISLNKLLELVCEHKQLDAEKYEFRNPVDPSQVYSTELTIGAVGLSEIRLCHKSESYDSFNADEVIKLHRTSIIRDSLSSSEFSRHSKHTTKTASPYSSSNSLNSMDSAGVNYTRTPISPPPPALPNSAQPKMLAPPRKKRAAPRPPSQTVIPEKSALVLDCTQNGNNMNGNVVMPATELTPTEVRSMPRYYVSTPNLSLPPAQTSIALDCNGNMSQSLNNGAVVGNGGCETNGHHTTDDYDSVDAQVDQKNARNLYGGSVQNLSSPTTAQQQAQKFPEPSPRKRLLNIKKKSAPAPPPGMNGSMYSEDSISIASNASTPGTPQTPISEHRSMMPPQTPEPTLSKTAPPSAASPAISVTKLNSPVIEVKPLPRDINTTTGQPLQTSSPVEQQQQPLQQQVIASPPKPVPRLTTTTTLLNASSLPASTSSAATVESVSAASTTPTTPTTPPANNVSKVLLNRTPTPEPRSLSTEPPLDLVLDSSLSTTHETRLNDLTHDNDNDDNISKQADSGIGEPVPSPLPDSLPSEGSTHECKSTFESSSDDDDMIKVYNFKLGKTVIKPLRDAKTLDDLTAIAAESDSGENTPIAVAATSTAPLANGETTSWNFAIPISPPPNFADTKKSNEEQFDERTSDAPITPKILERPVLNFEAITADNMSSRDVKKEVKTVEKVEEKSKPAALQNLDHVRATTPLPSPTAPLNEILDELNTIISEKRMDTLIKKAEEQPEIEAAKPNTLTNFSITTITQQTTKPIEIQNNISSETIGTPTTPDEEKLYRKHGNNTNVNNAILRSQSVTRSDSFHNTTVTQVQQAVATISTPDANGMTSRSSSYLSLTKIEQNGLNLNRRRSSSELSIGESPSLQSPEVIKTILNSRKNSLANSSDGESKAAIAEVINRIETTITNNNSNNNNNTNVNNNKKDERLVVEPKSITTIAAPAAVAVAAPATITTKEADCVQEFIEHEKEREETDKEQQQQQQQPKELPKVYRYSGPPSINFSTWSERPKVQVSIKNEGDYIFGGKNASTPNAAVTNASIEINTNSMPRNFRASTPAEVFWAEQNKLKQIQQQQPPAVPPKPETTTIQRMGIPEKEFHVPVVVKPLKDEIVENVVVEVKRPPVVESAKTKTSITTVTLNGNDNANNHIVSSNNNNSSHNQTVTATTTATVMRRTIAQPYSNSTLPRANSNANRFSMPAPIVTLRTTAVPIEINKPKATTDDIVVKSNATTTKTATETAPPSAPFGQNTLRKTGLKEKILAKEEAEQQQIKTNGSSVFINSSTNNNNHSSSTTTTTNSYNNNSSYVSSNNNHSYNNNNGSSGNSNFTTTTKLNKPVNENGGIAKSVVTINATTTTTAATAPKPTNITTKPTITIKTSGTGKPFVAAKTPTTLQSAKLEMKLQNQPAVKATTITTTTTAAATAATTTSSSVASVSTAANTTSNTNHISTISFLKPTTTISKTAPTTPTAPAPPPPPPPTIGGNTLKKTTVRSKSASATPTSPLDTRDQLLEAIRNFKREDLHRH